MRAVGVDWSVGVGGDTMSSTPSPWWTVWRRHRAALAIVAGGVLLLAAIAVVIEGSARSYRQESAASTGPPVGGVYHLTDFAPGLLLLVVLVVPSLAGAVMGARVWARELERGTSVVLFSQGVARRRWWVATMIALGAAPALLFAALGMLLNGLPLTGPGWSLQPSAFLGSGPVLGGYYFLAFGLAVLVGVLTRNTAATIVITLALQAAVAVTLSLWLRPHYLPPVETTIPLDLLGTDIQPTPDMPVGPDLTLGYWYVSADGASVPDSSPTEHCMKRASADPSWTQQDTLECDGELGIVAQRVTFQPIERWPAFQAIETALTAALGLLMAAGALGALRRWHR